MKDLDEALLARAIDALGGAAFPRALARLLETLLGCDCLLMVGYRTGGRALYLYDNLRHRRELLFQQYLNGLYTEDPFCRALSAGLAEGVYSLRVLAAAQGMAPHYLAAFYRDTGWQEELGLVIRLNDGQWLMIFFGRLQARPFTPAEQAELRRRLPLLGALCRRHWPGGIGPLALSPPGAADMDRRVQAALASFGRARLTRREGQVASLLVQGLDNGAIAAGLGIGEGTVKNHRKHLYAKFGVDSRAALFALFLNHLITGDGESGRREG
ncbi:helix-turn-helix transcriptional regulator [Zobellella sp. An-6]|uniref:helix-turn-helix transcriptional regulator n=1 Tax=Zobellella sp. An-6 TaxID=3400218 RepID=UPI004042B2E3